jgi:Flp pilus assembly protein TadD
VAGLAAVYAQALGHQFLLNWDDLGYVVENEAAHGLSWAHLAAAFTRPFVGNYAPVHVISYMLDHELWGLRPAGYVAVNVVLHAACAAALFSLVRRLAGRADVALLAAALFAFHPVQVEAVAWISQRKTLLAALFTLAAFHFHLDHQDGRRPRWSYALSLLAFGLALLAKPVAVVFPVALGVHARCAGRRLRLAGLLPFGACAVAAVLGGIATQPVVAANTRLLYLGADGTATALTMGPVLLRYLGLLAWPARLSAVYDVPIRARPDPAAVAALAAVLALVAVGAWLWRRRRQAFFPYALFFLGLLPVCQVVPLVTTMNDRYLYFPLLGAAPLAAAALLGQAGGAVRWRWLRPALAAGLVLGLGWTSAVRVGAWRDDLTLWSDAASRAPRSAMAWFSLGRSLEDAGRGDESLLAYASALAVDAEYRPAVENMGGLAGLHRARELLAARAAGDAPSFEDLARLGAVALLLRDAVGSRAAFERALAARPGALTALHGLGRAWLAAGALEQAREVLAAASSGPGSALVEVDRARVEALADRRPEALQHLRLALRLGYKDRFLLLRDPVLSAAAGGALAPLLDQYLRR